MFHDLRLPLLLSLLFFLLISIYLFYIYYFEYIIVNIIIVIIVIIIILLQYFNFRKIYFLGKHFHDKIFRLICNNVIYIL